MHKTTSHRRGRVDGQGSERHNGGFAPAFALDMLHQQHVVCAAQLEAVLRMQLIYISSMPESLNSDEVLQARAVVRLNLTAKHKTRPPACGDRRTCEAGAKFEAGVQRWLRLRLVIAHDHDIAVTKRVCSLYDAEQTSRVCIVALKHGGGCRDTDVLAADDYHGHHFDQKVRRHATRNRMMRKP